MIDVSKVEPSAKYEHVDFKNHGEYVKQAGDKADAAHSCIGMPIN